MGNRNPELEGKRQTGEGGQREKMGLYSAFIRENISDSILLERHPYDWERLDGFVELMAEICCSTRKTCVRRW